MAPRTSKMSRLSLSLAAVFLISVFSGCTSPAVEVPEGELSEGEGILLTEGWRREAPGGEFQYTNGQLQASVEGDQLLLRITTTETIDLGRLSWRIKGNVRPDAAGRTYTRHFALWNEEDPWPSRWFARSFVSEYAAVGLDVMGVTVDEKVDDPQITVFDLVEEPTGGYIIITTLGSPLVLTPGTWRLWFGVATSSSMEIEIALPELRLASPPAFSQGCEVVLPSQFDQHVLVTVPPAGAVVRDARATVEVPNGSVMKGAYIGGGYPVVDGSYRFTFPDRSSWSYALDPFGDETTDASGWKGRVLASESAGRHLFEIEREDAVGTPGPGLTYCVIDTGT